MPNSGESASRRCFSSVLGRLLCAGSLPTHPSEQLVEPSSIMDKSGDRKDGNSAVNGPGISSPGVVARLMGLESFPETPGDRTLGDYFRSKSVNSIDFVSYFDPIKQGHRRVRTSVSFRYHQGGIDDFTSVILHENRDEEEEEELFIRKLPEIKNRENFQVSNGPGKNRENFQVFDRKREKNRKIFQVSNGLGRNREIFQVSEGKREKNRGNFQDSGPGNLAKKEIQKKKCIKLKERRPIIKEKNSKEKMVGSKCEKKKKKILVHCNKKIHPEIIVPEAARSPRNQRRPQTAQSPYSRISNSENILIIENTITAGEIERKAKDYERMVEEICMLSEEHLKESWIQERVLKFEGFEEIIQQFGEEILEMMLGQFVDELVILFGTMK